jgi:hypothetical protein
MLVAAELKLVDLPGCAQTSTLSMSTYVEDSLEVYMHSIILTRDGMDQLAKSGTECRHGAEPPLAPGAAITNKTKSDGLRARLKFIVSFLSPSTFSPAAFPPPFLPPPTTYTSDTWIVLR